MTNTNTTDANARKKALVDRIMLRWQAAQAERGPWLGLWQQMADYVRPNRSTVKGRMDAPSLAGFEAVFDGTAISANMTLASVEKSGAGAPTGKTAHAGEPAAVASARTTANARRSGFMRIPLAAKCPR